MTKYIFLPILLSLLAFTSFAQEEEEDQEKLTKDQIKANKVAFITSKLDLSVEEAQKFWPVYNEHEKKMEEFHTTRRKNMKKVMHKHDELSDDDLLVIIDEMVDLDLKEANENKAYIGKVKTILPVKKIVKLFEAEREFKHSLLKEYRGRHGKGNGHGHGGPPMH